MQSRISQEPDSGRDEDAVSGEPHVPAMAAAAAVAVRPEPRRSRDEALGQAVAAATAKAAKLETPARSSFFHDPERAKTVLSVAAAAGSLLLFGATLYANLALK